MAMAVGLDPCPAEQSGGAVSAASKRWIALFVVLAAGWGTLFGYSVTFLSEDLPFRPAATLNEPPTFGFPPLPRPVVFATVAQAPTATASRAAAESAPALPSAPAPVQPLAQTSVQAMAPAAAPSSAQAPRVERADYVGTWGPTEAACGRRSRRRGYIPATITPERASAGRTICSFHDGRRVGNVWTMAADCADRGRRWSSQVRLVVDGDRLTWTSGKGSASYVRCGRRAG